MNYYFKGDKLIAFTESLNIESRNKYIQDEEFCIDENGYNLLTAINPKSVKKIDGQLVLDGKTKIKLLDKKPIDFDDSFDTELFIDLDKLKVAAPFAEQKNTNRPILQGVYVNSNGTIIASDSFKVYLYDNGESDDYVVLDKDLVKEICKYTGLQLFRYNKTIAQVFIEDLEITITGRLYQGVFPNIYALVKQYAASNTSYVLINKNDFDKHMNIAKYIQGNSKVCKLENKTISVYDYVDESDVYVNDLQTESNIDFNFILNFDQLKLSTSCFTNDVCLLFADQTHPVVLKEKDDDKIFTLLIPLRSPNGN